MAGLDNMSGLGSLQAGIGRLTRQTAGRGNLVTQSPLLCRVTGLRPGTEKPVQVADVGSQATLPWARVVRPFTGFEKLPKEGDYVLVDFVGKDFNSPVVVGSVSSAGTVITEHTDGSFLLRVGDLDIAITADGKTVEFRIPPGGVLKLGDASNGVARVGDSVVVNIGGTDYTGAITQGSAQVRA